MTKTKNKPASLRLTGRPLQDIALLEISRCECVKFASLVRDMAMTGIAGYRWPDAESAVETLYALALADRILIRADEMIVLA